MEACYKAQNNKLNRDNKLFQKSESYRLWGLALFNTTVYQQGTPGESPGKSKILIFLFIFNMIFDKALLHI